MMKRFKFIVVFGLTLVFCLVAGRAFSIQSAGLSDRKITRNFNSKLSILAANPLEQEAQRLYELRQFEAAIRVLQEVIRDYTSQGNFLGQAKAMRNLALVYIQMGNLDDGNPILIDSLNLVRSLGSDRESQQLLAEILEVKGKQEIDAGDAQTALETWKSATDIYQEIDDVAGVTRSQINQAKALQSLGLYERAGSSLEELRDRLQEQPNTTLKAKALQSLGDVLRNQGNFERSQSVLQESLTVAEQGQDSEVMASIFLSLGNTVRAILQDSNDPSLGIETLSYYQKAVVASNSPELQIQAQLNQLSLLAENGDLVQVLPQVHPPNADWLQGNDPNSVLAAFVGRIQAKIDGLPPNRDGIYARINFASTLMTLQEKRPAIAIAPSQIAQNLSAAVNHAQTLGDKQAEAYALGNLGQLYRQANNLEEAQKALEQGLSLAQGINSSDIAYQWQWQLGQVLNDRGDREGAIAAYSQSVNTLKSIRSDLAAVSSDVQFTFRESVEPVYRQFVDLLLQPDSSQGDLAKARLAIEALQVAELDNFFQEACTDAEPVQIDQVDVDSAVFYAALLSDRLEVILALPGQPLTHYSTKVPQREVEINIRRLGRALGVTFFRNRSNRSETIEQFQANYDNPSRGIRAVRLLDSDSAQWERAAENLYDWLIRPAEADLRRNNPETLVFVLDGVLRNIPMSVLDDGEQYLIEKYSLAITPGLQLLDPKPIPRSELRTIAAGLSEQSDETENHRRFPAIPNVEKELKDIAEEVPSEVLLNQEFTENNFSQLVRSSRSPIVHLATHGQFGSEAENTFILTWDDTLDANNLKYLLQDDPRQKSPIELLVLSACETATGDDRAALGLAGVAVRAGARSTLASLWKVSDEATAQLMTRFYQEFANSEVTKAEALRRAQLQILQSDRFNDPYFWGAFVLVGNWL